MAAPRPRPRPRARPSTETAPPPMAPAGPEAVRLVDIDKRFGPVHANRAVSMTIRAGSIHGIVGENGAGKSTCMNILYGFYRADAGTILIDGEPRAIAGTQDAIRAGIGMVHQHFMLVEPFTVLENLLLGAEGGPLLRGGAARAREEIARLERDYGLEVDLDAVVGDLPVGVQQRVEILKALFRGARILILDEPTGVLTPQEVDDLFRILRNLRDQGRTVVMITHKLREIMAVTDAVTVMRQGRVVAERLTAETSTDELAELMVGRKVQLGGGGGARRPSARAGAPVLEVEDLTVVDAAGVPRVKGVSFEVREGEIVGIAGVAGNGQSELLEALGGIRPIRSGRAAVRGHPIRGGEDRRGRPRGLGHVPEDRLRMGMVREFAAYENAVLGYHLLPAYGRRGGGLLDWPGIVAACRRWMRRYDVRPPEPHLRAASFSGGNQQKLVLAREMEHDPELLLVGQPTRGVDIGAIEFIHRRLIETRDAGKAVLLVSVELDEILALADRILVMFDGAIMGEVPAQLADERRLGLLMAGVTEGRAA